MANYNYGTTNYLGKIILMSKVQGQKYSVEYIEKTSTVDFIGDISLGGTIDYAPIVSLLEQSANTSEILTLNLKGLSFLNSSGISMLSKFVIGFRKRKNVQLVVIGSKNIPWQAKSLKNLEKLLPGLKLQVE